MSNKQSKATAQRHVPRAAYQNKQGRAPLTYLCRSSSARTTDSKMEFYVLILRKRWKRLEVLCESFTSDSEDVTIDEAGCDEVFQDRWSTADGIQVFHEVFSAGRKVGKEWNSVADALDIINGQWYLCSTSHGEEMKHAIGGSAASH